MQEGRKEKQGKVVSECRKGKNEKRERQKNGERSEGIQKEKKKRNEKRR